MVVSTGQRGGNFKGSKHQRSKPKKQDVPKQDGGFLEWLVPPLAIAKIARQKKARRKRAMMIRRRRMRERMMMNRERRPTNYRQNDRGYQYARPRTSRNFYINVSNNSSRNNSKQLKPATTTTTNQTRPWVDRRRSQVGQTGGIVADSRKLARKALRYNLQYYKRK
jgi:hypothetical protein